jgi:hypothetical protein
MPLGTTPKSIHPDVPFFIGIAFTTFRAEEWGPQFIITVQKMWITGFQNHPQIKEVLGHYRRC